MAKPKNVTIKPDNIKIKAFKRARPDAQKITPTRHKKGK